MAYVSLHTHSHFSLLDGLSKIPDLVARASDLAMPALALTDHGALYGAIEFYNTCRDKEIKPIIGMEAYIAPRSMADKNVSDANYFHLTLLAENDTGYKNLLLLSTLAFTEGFYYKPRLDLETLQANCEGLIALSGCQRGAVARAISENGNPQEVLNRYLAIFGRERFVIEIQRNAKTETEKNKEKALNGKLVELAKENQLLIAATADSHYLDKEDSEAQDVLVCIGTGRTVDDPNRLDMRNYELSLKGEKEMLELFADIPEAVNNTGLIAERCNIEIPINQRYFAKVKLPEGETSEDHLRKLVFSKSLKDYGVNGKLPAETEERILYELDIICKKGFAPYFLMVANIVEGAHSMGAITNTRGSAAGSIVGKILGITNVDPLFYELPFERFLTMHRPTPPDIDLDIADNRRDEVIQWMTEEYGKDKVAQIITFGTMKARAVVRDVGRALGIPYGKCDRIAKMIPIGKQGFDMTLETAMKLNHDLANIYQQDPETKKILDLAKKLEGCVRHASIHAAGIVVTPQAMTEIIPLQKEPEGQRLITQYDMYALDVNANANAIGAIKIDLLGIRNLSILEASVRLVEGRHNITVDLEKLPHPDAKTFKLLSEGHTFGVFQLGSSGMTRYLKELRPSSIFDVSAMIALYRPGPLQFIPEYIARKHNPKLIKYLDPELERILSRTYGILVYQDDLLIIAHDLAGYTWEEVDKFRKAVGKKIPAEMAKQKEKFIKGCIQTSGWSEAKANEVWAWIEPFAAYGFNKAHSASYAAVSYQTAYMKANYPVEFMAAVMTAESGDETKIYAAVEECRNLGIQVLPPDVNESQGDFTVVNENTIRFGLNAIKNLGSDVVTQIITENFQGKKPFSSLEDFLVRSHTKNLNKKSWEALVKAGALDKFDERGKLLANTEVVLEFLRAQTKDSNSQSSLFAPSVLSHKAILKDAPPATEPEKLMWEKEYLGFFVSSHPLENYKLVLEHFPRIGDSLTAKEGTLINLGGIISKIKRTLTKKNDPMAFFTLEDPSGSIEVLVFPKVMAETVPLLNLDNIIEVTGRISDKDGEPKLIANQIKQLPNDETYTMALSEMEKNRQVVIYLPNQDPEALQKLKTIIEAHPGNAQIFLKIGTPDKAKTIKAKSSIRLSPTVISAITAMPEVSGVTAN